VEPTLAYAGKKQWEAAKELALQRLGGIGYILLPFLFRWQRKEQRKRDINDLAPTQLKARRSKGTK
jgi:hypothetical protein